VLLLLENFLTRVPQIWISGLVKAERPGWSCKGHLRSIPFESRLRTEARRRGM